MSSSRTIAARRNARNLIEDGYSFAIVKGMRGKYVCNLPEDERARRERLNDRGMNKNPYPLEYFLDAKIEDGMIYVQCDCRAFSLDNECKHAARLWFELKKALPLAFHVQFTREEAREFMRKNVSW